MKFLFLRVLLPLLLFLVLRSVIRTLFASKDVSDSRGEAPRVPAGGELKKDPVCGTYVSAVSSVRETVGGELVYFCSDECRHKYAAARR